MSDASDAVDRIRSTTSRIDQFFAEAAEAQRREAEDDRRNQHQIDAAKRIDMQVRFDEAFTPFGERAPAPNAAADPADYRYDLMRLAKRKLGRDDERPVPGFPHATVSELARQKLSECGDAALNVLEPMLLAATKLQAAEPAHSTLPPAGQFVERFETDQTGVRKTKFHGRESFIKQLSRQGQRVSRIIDPVRKIVIWGAPFSRAE
jgi:hypothetical protein